MLEDGEDFVGVRQLDLKGEDFEVGRGRHRQAA